VLVFGGVAELGRRIGRSLIDATHSISREAAGMNRGAARFVREVRHGAETVDEASAGLVSRSGLAGENSGPHRESVSPAEPRPAAAAITRRDREVIHEITRGNGNYWRINRGLRAGDLTAEEQVFVRDLRAALAKLRNYRGKVFREVQLSAEEVARYQRGSIVTEPAFTSASRGRRSILGGNTRFTIRSSTGKSVSRYSAKPHEKEVLFAPGTSFEVVRVRYNKHWLRTEIEMVQR
jgi:hypothetical protein